MSTNQKEIAAKLKPPALAPQPITTDVLQTKYCKGEEQTQDDVRSRVAEALSMAERSDVRSFYRDEFLEAQNAGAVLAGRINSAAGTGLASTLINCFVQPVGDWIRGFENGIPGIFEANNQAAETMARGGGVGYDFSSIRPQGAVVKGKASIASGPISYMHVFDQMCKTVSSAGNRRGAQMGVLRIDHPDIEMFINEKSRPGLLTQFNVSVAVTDEFLDALKTGKPFELVHEAQPYADDVFDPSLERFRALPGLGEDDADERQDDGDPVAISLNKRAYQRDDGKWVYKTINPRALWDRIMQLTYDYAEPGILFVDNANRDNNLWYCEDFAATNPCAEQWLPPYGCCCLGSLNLTEFVLNPFGGSPGFAFDRFRKTVATTVRMLDNVLDVTYWPLEEQEKEAMNKRRIGLGFTGLGDALLMSNLRYDSEEGRAFAESIANAMRDAAYWASVELAKEKGAFPLFDPEKYLESEFAKRLPEDLRSAIRTHGIRNSHLLSIAPTGTISLAFADNASNGIEPAFSWYYTRKKLEADGSHSEFTVVDHAFRLFHRMTNQVDPCDCDSEKLKELSSDLPEHWVNALQISASDHLKMVAAVQPYIDSSISKTVNVPEDYPFEEFKDLYSEAAAAGLKGLATFRPSDVRGAVLSVEPSKKGEPENGELTFGQSDVDRRLTIDTHPEPVMGSLRWPKRPRLLNGNPSWTYMVKTDEHSFAIFVGHTENGTNHPFEVWTNGSEQPRGLGAIAKALSMDMRSNDRAFLMAKLDSLERSKGPTVIEHSMPPDGRPVMVSSLESLFAKIVKHRILELEAIPPRSSEGDKGQTDLVGTALTPMMDALMSPREPKTSDGTMAWCVDVRNHATGDDFVLMVKELMMPDGQRRPFSVWMSGEYPSVFNGLCKVLSFDMRILDPAWVGKKLRSLLDFAEPGGDFMAPVPGSKKSATFPSTVAYVARLLIHRYAMHGILSEDGFPVTEAGLMDDEYQNVVGLRNSRSASERGKGLLCPSCNTYHLIRVDSCSRCTECGYDAGCG